MVSDKIREIVNRRKNSISCDKEFGRNFNQEIRQNNKTSVSKAIKKNKGISIISEIKPASPTLGHIKKNINVKETAMLMESSNVIGLSILTEPNYFNGSYLNLKLAIENTKLPCLMKDFVVDPIQFFIANQLGATNILIINAIENQILENYYELAIKYNLEPLIEIHDINEIADIKHLFEIGYTPKLIGVNNRNLNTLNINLNTSKKIIPVLKQEFGEDIQIISESGINSNNDIKELLPYGTNAFLIGSSIMQSDDIKKKILQLRGVI
ncbi:MAG: indole-3-glycerol-phosphate synthase [Candidatus Lokiarchaeota archaeon]|nr:indole-3-glycerol-phosphate synthase [Candidatus Lokiarchaeota archaeon]